MDLNQRDFVRMCWREGGMSLSQISEKYSIQLSLVGDYLKDFTRIRERMKRKLSFPELNKTESQYFGTQEEYQIFLFKVEEFKKRSELY